MKQKTTGIVLTQREIAPAVFDLWLETALAREARPGQFIGVYPKDRSTLLPRPISICEVREDRKALRIVYRVAGQGTKEFSAYREGERVELLGVLGNGFPVEQGKGKRVFLMGGGIGIPPMLELAKALKEQKEEQREVQKAGQGQGQEQGQEQGQGSGAGLGAEDTNDKSVICSIMGYRDSRTFLKEDLERYSRVYIATEDGSVGTKGNVMDAIRENGLEPDVIFACGPMPMLRAIKAYAAEKGIPAYISLEEHMACGVGACLGCVVKTREKDPHSHVNNARICTDGPVFEAGEVEI